MCNKCWKLWESEKQEKQRIQSNFRVRKSRLKKKIEQKGDVEDGFSGISPLIPAQEYYEDLEKEKIGELKKLEKQKQPHKFILDSDVGWREYEDFIAEHGTLAWHRKHGTLPSSYKAVFTEKDVCSRCGKKLENCRCDTEKHNKDFNFEWSKR